MTVLKVRRPSATAPGVIGNRTLNFQGRRLPIGAEIETRDFPHINAQKWGQLVDQGWFENEGLMGDADIRREMRRRRDAGLPSVQEAPRFKEPIVPVMLAPEDAARLDKPIVLQCGDCGFQATSSQGLKIHTTRKHAKG